jgi:hypothetical protein
MALVSCKRENRCDCFKSGRNETTVVRNLDAFQAIAVHSVFDLEWKYDTVCSAAVTCGEKLADNIETSVVMNETSGLYELHVKNNNRCNWVRSQEKKIKILLKSPDIRHLNILSPCDFRTHDTVRTDLLKVDIHTGVSSVDMTVDCRNLYFSVHAGSGLFKLYGKTGVAYYYGMGNNHLHFENNVADYCYMEFRSTGQAYINVSKELGVTITGRGNVYYRGNPYQVDAREEAEGKLIKTD